jgi:hypothetical protein
MRCDMNTTTIGKQFIVDMKAVKSDSSAAEYIIQITLRGILNTRKTLKNFSRFSCVSRAKILM